MEIIKREKNQEKSFTGTTCPTVRSDQLIFTSVRPPLTVGEHTFSQGILVEHDC